jgi:pimeloyl-ACP methyl ester carboxylesterase
MTKSSVPFEETFTHHTADVNGVRLHYVIGGTGDPVLLCHGWLQTWYEWRGIMPALAEHYTVIAPDMRGFGDSAKPTTGYDCRTLGEDYYQLMQHLGFGRIFLVGHDMGGLPAYAYAAEHPDDVRRLVWLEMPVPGFGLEELMKFSKETSHEGGLWHITFNMVPDLPEALVAGRERIFLSYFYRKYCYDPTAISPESIDEYVRCYSAPGGLRASLGAYRDLFKSQDQIKEYAKTKLKMPVLALGGERSLATLMVSMMQALAVNVSGGVVERCGHFIPEERPDYLIEQLLSFFGEDEKK